MNIEGIPTGAERGDTAAPARPPLLAAIGAMGEDVQRVLHPHDPGEFLHGLLALPGDAARTVTEVAGDALGLAGRWVDEQPDVAGHLPGHLGEAGARLTALGGGLGRAADRLGRALESVAHGHLEDLTAAAEAITEGVSDVAQLRTVIEGLPGGG
jgi:hypothetical protein